MKARIKFKKYGALRFIGHLDVMRFFQKAIRRAHIPIAYTGGYSPHMIMSFAAPLGVGTTSMGEYFDMDLRKSSYKQKLKIVYNAVMVEGITNAALQRQVEDGKASTAMALVAAADYFVAFRPGKEPAGTGRRSWRISCTEGDHSNQKRQSAAKKLWTSVRLFIRWRSVTAAYSCSWLLQAPITPSRSL
mgnify:CR=1 FL=1